jgi:6-phosphogluconolactonase
MMDIKKFNISTELENALANSIISALENQLKISGSATLLVSGGTSPIGLFRILSSSNLDWSKITVGLVDERFVPITDEKSNALLVKENLLINNASKATFIGMVNNSENRELNLIQANKDYTTFKEKTTVCILGMGEDGHTASLFPNDKNSEKNLFSTIESLDLINTQAPVFPENRITCPKSLIVKSKNLYLMISGEKKLEILNESLEQKYPISYFAEKEKTTMSIYYSKNK